MNWFQIVRRRLCSIIMLHVHDRTVIVLTESICNEIDRKCTHKRRLSIVFQQQLSDFRTTIDVYKNHCLREMIYHGCPVTRDLLSMRRCAAIVSKLLKYYLLLWTVRNERLAWTTFPLENVPWWAGSNSTTCNDIGKYRKSIKTVVR